MGPQWPALTRVRARPRQDNTRSLGRQGTAPSLFSGKNKAQFPSGRPTSWPVSTHRAAPHRDGARQGTGEGPPGAWQVCFAARRRRQQVYGGGVARITYPVRSPRNPPTKEAWSGTPSRGRCAAARHAEHRRYGHAASAFNSLSEMSFHKSRLQLSLAFLAHCQQPAAQRGETRLCLLPAQGRVSSRCGRG
ncbi:hypothetical protein E2C01_071140 [Portunus trituberculatus]|uniref:Uncharacterized protein n=1 Tax=Portunus trituberculatus TaxID=210409 RepID=A0A5B7I7E8_PORTR|nr:hypothetical protein [Portunus trituberculatus]